MSRTYRTFLLFLLVSVSLPVFSQKTLPVGYFRSPLDIKHYVTGIFAEPRPDHMHAGIDFAVQMKIGLPIYAIADGYVSRIKVAPGGYGKALYVTHPNGYVSLYAHLSEYNVIVDDYVKRKQKEKESFEIELFPDPRLFQFSKGDIIGYSGNTGNSTGPHLHFEIRSEVSERIINPALFGIYASDIQAPFFRKLTIYPYGPESRVKAGRKPVMYSFEKKTGTERTYTLPDSVRVSGSCYFGVIARDLVSATNELGIYSLSMSVDDRPVFAYTLDSFSFDESRYANDLINYRQYLEEGDKFLLLKTGTCNCLPIYSSNVNHGILTFTRKDTLRIEIVAADVVGNSARLRFVMLGAPAADSLMQSAAKPPGTLFPCNQENRFEDEGIRLEVPKGALFDSLWFRYGSSANAYNSYSVIHHLDENATPLLLPIKVSIRPLDVPVELRSKIIMVRLEANRSILSLGGSWEEAWFTAKSFRFGKFLLAIDTTAPLIRNQNFSSGKNINGLKELKIKITDELSGIKTYRAELNNEWILMEYDLKTNMLSIAVDERFPRGTFELKISVTDVCGNEKAQAVRLNY